MSDPDLDFQLELLTPERAYPARRVRRLTAPGSEGSFTVLAGHQPFVFALREGTLEFETADGAVETWRLDGGVLHVEPGRVVVLSSRAGVAERAPEDGPRTGTPRTPTLSG